MTGRVSRRAFAFIVLCIGGGYTLTPAVAQQTGQQVAASETIVVTAQKREQDALDVPITLTAYSGDFLQSIGVEEFDDLSLFVPGLQIQEQSVNNPGFVIRGITSDSGSSQIAPRVSIYQDGIDISRSRGSIVELFDLERVEVVKGPQSTLFGSAASIGAIQLISARPEDEFGGRVSFGYGNYDEIKTSGHVTGPLIEDKLLGRVAWVYKKRDGFIENIDGAAFSQNPQSDQAPALNGTDTFAGRAFLSFLPTETLQIDLIFNYQKDTPPGSSFKSGTIPPTGGTTDPNTFAELGPFGSTESDVLGGDLGITREVWSVTLDVEYELNDQWSLSWISGYRTFDSLEVFDADGTAGYWLEFTEEADGEQWSTELRVNFDSGDKFTGFIGGSFFWEDGTQNVPFETDEAQFLACSPPPFGLGVCTIPGGTVLAAELDPTSPIFIFGPNGTLVPRDLATDFIHSEFFANTGRFEVYSVFIDGTYEVTEWLEVTAGVRYLYEERRSGYAAGIDNPSQIILLATGGLAAGPLLPTGNTGGEFIFAPKDDFDAVLPRFNIGIQASEDVNFYLSVGKGRRSPVIDVTADNFGGLQSETLRGEIIWNYEVGMKSRFAGGRVQFDAAFFYQDYNNFQTSIFTPTGAEPIDAGSATAWGWEAAVVGQASENITLFFNISYVNATFDQTDSDGNPQIFAGNRFRLQPTWSASGGLDVNQPVANFAEAFFTATWTFRSSTFFENENTPIAGLDISQDAVTLLNLKVGLRDLDEVWEVEFYVNNVFNTKYIIDAGNTGGVFGTPTFIAGPPRFYGVGVTGRF